MNIHKFVCVCVCNAHGSQKGLRWNLLPYLAARVQCIYAHARTHKLVNERHSVNKTTTAWKPGWNLDPLE